MSDRYGYMILVETGVSDNTRLSECIAKLRNGEKVCGALYDLRVLGSLPGEAWGVVLTAYTCNEPVREDLRDAFEGYLRSSGGAKAITWHEHNPFTCTWGLAKEANPLAEFVHDVIDVATELYKQGSRMRPAEQYAKEAGEIVTAAIRVCR